MKCCNTCANSAASTDSTICLQAHSWMVKGPAACTVANGLKLYKPWTLFPVIL